MKTDQQDLPPGKPHRKRRRKRTPQSNTSTLLALGVRFSARWTNPSRQKWILSFLVSWLLWQPSSFPEEATLLFAEVHRRLDAFSRQTWVPFSYKRAVLALSDILSMDPDRLRAEAKLEHPSFEVMRILTEASWLLVDERVFYSMVPLYEEAVASRQIVFQSTSADVWIERHKRSIPLPFHRGYRDKGSLRPATHWLPPLPRQEDKIEVDPFSVTELERFRRDTRESP